MTAQSTDLLSLGPVDIFWSARRPLYVVIKKKGPIKPSHQRQILPAKQSLLITANSWRSFQRGLYQGQEHLDLNYPWHNVWPFCYHWGGQHLLRGHGPRGHRGYPGQQCKSQLTTSSPIRILSSSHRSLSLTPATGMESGPMLVVIITLRTISWDRLRTAGRSHDVQTHDLRATAANCRVRGHRFKSAEQQNASAHESNACLFLGFNESLKPLPCIDH